MQLLRLPLLVVVVLVSWTLTAVRLNDQLQRRARAFVLLWAPLLPLVLPYQFLEAFFARPLHPVLTVHKKADFHPRLDLALVRPLVVLLRPLLTATLGGHGLSRLHNVLEDRAPLRTRVFVGLLPVSVTITCKLVHKRKNHPDVCVLYVVTRN